MKFELKQHFQIESARFLPNLVKTHPCHRMHGHSFKVILTLRGEQNPQIGWVRDYNDISQIALKTLNLIDHHVLNEVQGLKNPTSENLAVWIYDKIKQDLSELYQVSIQETPSTECTYPIY